VPAAASARWIMGTPFGQRDPINDPGAGMGWQ
jgi:hypothetical protein